MAKILVTGANGFIGRSLSKRLVSEGHAVIPVVRVAAGLVGEIVVGDIYNFDGWAALLTGVDVVVHLAARAHVLQESVDDPLKVFRRTNRDAAVRLAQTASGVGVRRFVFMSTIGVHGATTNGKPFDVEDAPAPSSPYAVSKYEAELGLRDVAAGSGLELVVIRPPLVYGPGAPGNFRVMEWLLVRGVPLPLGAITDNRRSLIFVDNLSDLTEHCVWHPGAAGGTFLAADGEDLSTAALLTRLGAALGRPARLFRCPASVLSFGAKLFNAAGVERSLLGSLQVGISHTCRVLDWSPPFSVEQGLSSVGRFYRKMRA